MNLHFILLSITRTNFIYKLNHEMELTISCMSRIFKLETNMNWRKYKASVENAGKK